MNMQDSDALRRLILDGDLYNLEQFIHGFRDKPQELAELINNVRGEINCSAASIPSTVVISIGRYDQRNNHLVLLSIQLHSAKRAVQICSNPTFRTIVMGPTVKNECSMLAPTLDDPAVVLKQAARLFSLPNALKPPPLSQPARPWSVF